MELVHKLLQKKSEEKITKVKWVEFVIGEMHFDVLVKNI